MNIKKLAPFFIAALVIGATSFAIVSYAKNDKNDKNDSEKEKHLPVCAKGSDEENPRCNARIVIEKDSSPKVTILPAGYGPAQFRGAYQISGITTTNQTIAIVDAY